MKTNDSPAPLNSSEAILREMGIAPLWRLKSAVLSGQSLEMSLNDETVGVNPAPAPSLCDGDAGASDWGGLLQKIADCRACELCQQRHQVVPGVGDLRPEWLFIGEGPGAEEDARGEPFVGQAGRLLDNMLAALGLQRGNGVYIANAVKCRPPGNRTPEAHEISACRPFLAQQIRWLKPKVIVLLGKVAVHSVLRDDNSLARLRQQVFQYEEVPTVVTYHPAYLLRNLADKSKAWEDLLFARQILRGEQR